MWNASAVSAAPTISATGVAPRSSACASDSTTTTPAPSPNTKPSRSRSNGRDARLGSSLRFDSAPMLPSAATRHRPGSAPRSRRRARRRTRPSRISRSASWKAMTDVAQAATWVITGPVRPYFIDTCAARHRARQRRDRERADTKRGPFWSWTWVPSMTCSMPPPPVLTTTPTRSRCSCVIAAKSMPESATASLPAAIAKWMNRLIRRAILRPSRLVGSKSLTSAAIRTSKPDASKLRDRPRPGHPGAEVRPVRREVVADRRDRADAGHDRAAGRIATGSRGAPRAGQRGSAIVAAVIRRARRRSRQSPS